MHTLDLFVEIGNNPNIDPKEKFRMQNILAGGGLVDPNEPNNCFENIRQFLDDNPEETKISCHKIPDYEHTTDHPRKEINYTSSYDYGKLSAHINYTSLFDDDKMKWCPKDQKPKQSWLRKFWNFIK